MAGFMSLVAFKAPGVGDRVPLDQVGLWLPEAVAYGCARGLAREPSK